MNPSIQQYQQRQPHQQHQPSSPPSPLIHRTNIVMTGVMDNCNDSLTSTGSMLDESSSHLPNMVPSSLSTTMSQHQEKTLSYSSSGIQLPAKLLYKPTKTEMSSNRYGASSSKAPISTSTNNLLFGYHLSSSMDNSSSTASLLSSTVSSTSYQSLTSTSTSGYTTSNAIGNSTYLSNSTFPVSAWNTTGGGQQHRTMNSTSNMLLAATSRPRSKTPIRSVPERSPIEFITTGTSSGSTSSSCCDLSTNAVRNQQQTTEQDSILPKCLIQCTMYDNKNTSYMFLNRSGGSTVKKMISRINELCSQYEQQKQATNKVTSFIEPPVTEVFILAQWSLDSYYKVVIRSKGGIAAIVRAMQTFTHARSIQECGCLCLRNLVICSDRNHTMPRSSTLANTSCSTSYEAMASSNCNRRWSTENDTSSGTPTVSTHSFVQPQGILSSSVPMKTLVTSSSLNSIPAAARTPTSTTPSSSRSSSPLQALLQPGDPSTQSTVCSCCCTKMVSTINEVGGINAVIHAMQLFPQSVAVQTIACDSIRLFTPYILTQFNQYLQQEQAPITMESDVNMSIEQPATAETTQSEDQVMMEEEMDTNTASTQTNSFKFDDLVTVLQRVTEFYALPSQCKLIATTLMSYLRNESTKFV